MIYNLKMFQVLIKKYYSDKESPLSLQKRLRHITNKKVELKKSDLIVIA